MTERELGVSKDTAGVNMRLNAGGVRELHWHKAAEWAPASPASALADQQTAGAIMWVSVTFLYLVPAVVMTVHALSPSISTAEGTSYLISRRTLRHRKPA